MYLQKLTGSLAASFSSNGGRIRRYLLMLAWFVVITSLFALAYNQAPLYTSNQNQYFLHGYAQAGYGTLSEDWLANTADPTPVFSSLVALTIRFFHSEVLFFVYYALLMGVYIFSLFGIIDHVYSLRSSKLTTHIFIVAIILIHSTALRFLFLRWFGGDWPYLFEGGFAGQRLLGVVFQPSTFGVFLLLSIYFYLKDRQYLAVFSAVLAATFHPTYLLSAAALTVAYMIDTLRRQRKIWPAVRVGLLALVTVSPILVYTYTRFGGASPTLTATADDILVNIRIPPHAIVSEWFNATVVVKLLFLGFGLFLVRRQRLFGLLLVPLILSIGLTIIQVIIKNNALALIFPWRLSTWLVPVSVGLIVAKLTTMVTPKVPVSSERTVRMAGFALIAVAVAAGITRTFLESNESNGIPFRPLEAYIATHRQPGQIYLIPPKLDDFRLEAGVPIYVDFLAIPYQAADVVEWDYRYRMASYFYQKPNCDLLAKISDQGVTQVVLPSDYALACPEMMEVYEDSAYKLYRLTP